MTGPATYWRTIRHLKARQVVGRIRFKLGARLPKKRRAPPKHEPRGVWVKPARRAPSLVAPEQFVFLSRQRHLDDGGWDPVGDEKLWRYNLHYFDDLNAEGAELRRQWHAALIDRWIAENPAPCGTGWEPYPTSLRVVNWIKWFVATGEGNQERLDSLAGQVRWLERRIEWHLLGNHLLANAKALYIAGLFFCGPEADRWRKRGFAILARELPEQVLADGGHFERSPMYHLLVLEDVLDLMSFLGLSGARDGDSAALMESLRGCASRMLPWAHVMRFADGGLPRFNDASDGIAPSYPQLLRMAGELGLLAPVVQDTAVRLLPDSGYVRLHWDDAAAFLDVAPVGPDYLPGHAHADTLSFELEIAGRQIVVNRGTSCYGDSPRRKYERSTAAHSTVEVSGVSSSEVWGGFRVGRRARPCDLQVTADVVSCSHDGYRFLPGRPVHRRSWTRVSRGLRVEDVVSGGWPGVVRYHLAPGLHADRVSARMWRIHGPEGDVAQVEFGSDAVRAVPGEHAVGFGRLVAAQSLEFELIGGRATANWNW